MEIWFLKTDSVISREFTLFFNLLGQNLCYLS